jgi:hypothetical protein
MLGAALAAAVSAFLPWASLLGINKLGTEGDGTITLIGALIGLLAFRRRFGGWILPGVVPSGETGLKAVLLEASRNPTSAALFHPHPARDSPRRRQHRGGTD